jgi:BirA family transcriptional regulator, biotin operon repressor / biotin---[acetyl-CoA-carboxylase] ligase
MFFGRPTEYYTELSSTMDAVRERARAGAPEGLVIAADRQTAGRGRLGRVWSSPPGALCFSLLLRPKLPIDDLGLLSICFGVAAANAVRDITQLPVGLKWPNDLVINDKKLAGLLIETELHADVLDFAVLGMGINVNVPQLAFPPELQHQATSLLIETGNEVSKDALLQAILLQSEKCYKQLLAQDYAALEQQWNELDATRGRRVRYSRAGEIIAGVAAGLAPNGALQVNTDQGMQTVSSGEVEWW